MKKPLSFVLVLAVLTTFVGCKKEAPSKPISAEFTYQYFTGTTYTFSAGINSLGATNEHVWDFGDGTIEKNVTIPTHAFPAIGTYTVKHKVYSVDGFDIATQEINVGTGGGGGNFAVPYSITDIVINQYPTTKPGGGLWDPGTISTGPDVKFQICASNGAVLASTTSWEPTSLPESYMVTPFNVMLTANVAYTIKAFDDDFIQGTADEPMGSILFKLSDFMPTASSRPTSAQISGNGFVLTIKVQWL